MLQLIENIVNITVGFRRSLKIFQQIRLSHFNTFKQLGFLILTSNNDFGATMK